MFALAPPHLSSPFMVQICCPIRLYSSHPKILTTMQMTPQKRTSTILCTSYSHWPCAPDDPEAALSSMLPHAYIQKEIDARVIVPAHHLIKSQLENVHHAANLNLIGTTDSLQLSVGITHSGLMVYLVELPGTGNQSFHTGKSTAALMNYALFSRAVVAVAKNCADLQWQPNIVHLNDWQTGLIPALLQTDDANNVKTVFTLPKGSEFGCIEEHIYRSYYLPQTVLTEDGVLWNGDLSLLKAATVYADELVLRGPGLLAEVTTTSSQNKMAYLLQSRKGPISHFHHGVNHLLWNPATDTHTVQQYDTASFELKKINKLRLQQRLGQDEDASIMLLAYCGPVTQNSGISHILSTLPDLVSQPGIKLVIQAWGDKDSVDHLLNQQATYPEVLTVLLNRDEELHHQIVAAADCLLLPGLFPISGESAVVALTYGTVPIATDSGAHKDYITNTTSRSSLNGSATGFLYPVDRPSALLDTILRAKTFRDKPGVWWEKVTASCMNHPFTAEQTVLSYIQLYDHLSTREEL